MYSLDCSYYDKEFPTINELVEDIIQSGMDPNYKITLDGRVLDEEAISFIQF